MSNSNTTNVSTGSPWPGEKRVPPRAIQEISHLFDDMMVVEQQQSLQPNMTDDMDSEQEDNYENDGFVEMDDDYKEHETMKQEIQELQKKKKPTTTKQIESPKQMDEGQFHVAHEHNTNKTMNDANQCSL